MNWALPVGAALCFLIGVVHSYLGERYILIRLFRRELPKLFGSDWFTRRTLRFVWHVTTLGWWGFGALLLVLDGASPEGQRTASLQVIAVTFLITAIVAAAASRGRHLSWIVFLAIALAAWLGQ